MHAGQTSLVLISSSGGEDRHLINPRPFANRWAPSDWSPAGRWILASTRLDSGRWVIRLLPVSAAPAAEAQQRGVASSADGQALWQTRFSLDGRWISFIAVGGPSRNVSSIHVVPASGGEWIRITDGGRYDDKPRWSPDGRTIYFLSNRSGVYDIWSIRFDLVEGGPLGEPRQVTALGNPIQLVTGRLGLIQLSVTADRLMLPVTEATG